MYIYLYMGYFPTKDIQTSDGLNNCNRNRNRDAVVSTTTATAVIFFNNRVHFKKFLFKKKFVLPILKFEL